MYARRLAALEMNQLIGFRAHFQYKSCLTVSKRFKTRKIHWADVDRKIFATDKALKHFDDFYKTIFRLKWPSVRLALLSSHKYIAVVNNFGDVDETQEQLDNLGALSVKTLFENHNRNLNKAAKEKEQMVIGSGVNLDKLIEARRMAIEEEELNLLYPDGSGDKLKGILFCPEEEKEQKVDAEYYSGSDSDSDPETEMINKAVEQNRNRLIDPELGLDASSIHEFVPATQLKGMEEYTSTDMPICIEEEIRFEFPEHLKVYSFDRGDMSSYPSPKRCKAGVLNYYLMDGACLLPVLALGLKPGDNVLDMCAAPGGKALAAFQTLYPKLLVANDVSRSRKLRIGNVFAEYLYAFQDTSLTWKDMLLITNLDGASIEDVNLYDKILVDVPCTNDRLSLTEEDNNIFKQSRIKERLRLPEIQAALLANALKLVRPGGTVVYSTCTLSPIQNDGVVNMALRKLWEETKMEFTVINMTPALQCTSHLYKYGKDIGLRFGHLIVPFLPSNFGPLYFCKIVKNN